MRLKPTAEIKTNHPSKMFNSLHLSEVLMLWLIGVYISSVLTLDNLA